MHKKHYKLLAEAFARLRSKDDELTTMSVHEVIDEIEDEICRVLNHDNPAFSYEKFTDASGRRD